MLGMMGAGFDPAMLANLGGASAAGGQGGGMPGMGFLQMLAQSFNPQMEASKGPNSVEEAGGLQPLSLPPDPAKRQIGSTLGQGLQGMGGQMMKQGASQMAQPMKPPAAAPAPSVPFQPMSSAYQAPGSHLKRPGQPMQSPFMPMGGR